MDAGDWIAVAAVVVAVVALVLSGLAYRQTARYHPQPKLVFEWDRELTGTAVPTYRVYVVNHGDAAARDLEFFVETSARHPGLWGERLILEPGATWLCDVPLVEGADWNRTGRGIRVTGAGPAVRPRVSLTWRQAPFSGPKKRVSALTPAPRSDGASGRAVTLGEP